MLASLLEDLVVSRLRVSYQPHIHADACIQEPDEIDALVKRTSAPPPGKLKAAKDATRVTGRFIGTLLKRLPDVVDGNPAKVALGIAKIILDIRDVCHIYVRWH